MTEVAVPTPAVLAENEILPGVVTLDDFKALAKGLSDRLQTLAETAGQALRDERAVLLGDAPLRRADSVDIVRKLADAADVMNRFHKAFEDGRKAFEREIGQEMELTGSRSPRTGRMGLSVTLNEQQTLKVGYKTRKVLSVEMGTFAQVLANEIVRAHPPVADGWSEAEVAAYKLGQRQGAMQACEEIPRYATLTRAWKSTALEALRKALEARKDDQLAGLVEDSVTNTTEEIEGEYQVDVENTEAMARRRSAG